MLGMLPTFRYVNGILTYTTSEWYTVVQVLLKIVYTMCNCTLTFLYCFFLTPLTYRSSLETNENGREGAYASSISCLTTLNSQILPLPFPYLHVLGIVILKRSTVHLVFVGLEKAYNRVAREESWRCMRMKGASEKCMKLEKDIPM